MKSWTTTLFVYAVFIFTSGCEGCFFFEANLLLTLQFWCITTDLVPEICLERLGFLFLTFQDVGEVHQNIYIYKHIIIYIEVYIYISINWFLEMAQIVGWRKDAHITNRWRKTWQRFARWWFYIFLIFMKWSNLTCAYFSSGLVQPPTSLMKTVNPFPFLWSSPSE